MATNAVSGAPINFNTPSTDTKTNTTSGTNAANKTKAGTTAEKQRTPKQDLGKDEFLKILSMQMANQDPLEPMKDTEFIAQMAQFSSLEQMQALNANVGNQQAYSLMGKNVLANVTDSNGLVSQIYGEVIGVMNNKGVSYLQIGEYYVPLDAVQTVYDDSSLDDLVLKGANLSGKHILAELPPEKEGGKAELVTGKVETVIIKNGMLHVKLEGVDKEVPVAYVKKVSDNVIEIPKDTTGTDDSKDDTTVDKEGSTDNNTDSNA